MKIENEHLIPFLIHSHDWINLSDNRNRIKNDCKGNEISLINGILISL